MVQASDVDGDQSGKGVAWWLSPDILGRQLQPRREMRQAEADRI